MINQQLAVIEREIQKQILFNDHFFNKLMIFFVKVRTCNSNLLLIPQILLQFIIEVKMLSPVSMKGIRLNNNSVKNAQTNSTTLQREFQLPFNYQFDNKSFHSGSQSIGKSTTCKHGSLNSIQDNCSFEFLSKTVHRVDDMHRNNRPIIDTPIKLYRGSVDGIFNPGQSLTSKIDAQLRKSQKQFPDKQWNTFHQKNNKINMVSMNSQEIINERLTLTSRPKQFQIENKHCKKIKQDNISQLQKRLQQITAQYEGFKEKTIKQKQESKQQARLINELRKENQIIKKQLMERNLYIFKMESPKKPEITNFPNLQNLSSSSNQPKNHRVIENSSIKKLTHQNQQLLKQINKLKQQLNQFLQQQKSAKQKYHQVTRQLQKYNQQNSFYKVKFTQCQTIIGNKQIIINNNNLQMQKLKNQIYNLNNLKNTLTINLQAIKEREQKQKQNHNIISLKLTKKVQQLQILIEQISIQKCNIKADYEEILSKKRESELHNNQKIQILNKKIQKLWQQKNEIIIEYNKRILLLQQTCSQQQKSRIKNQETIREMTKQVNFLKQQIKKCEQNSQYTSNIKIETQNNFLKMKINDLKQELDKSRQQIKKNILSHQKNIILIKNNCENLHRRQNYHIQEVNSVIKAYQTKNLSLSQRIKVQSSNEDQLKKKIQIQQLSIMQLKQKILIANRKEKSLQDIRRHSSDMAQQEFKITISQNEQKIKQLCQNINRKKRQNMEKDKFITEFLINRGHNLGNVKVIMDEMSKYFKNTEQNQ